MVHLEIQLIKKEIKNIEKKRGMPIEGKIGKKISGLTHPAMYISLGQKSFEYIHKDFEEIKSRYKGHFGEDVCRMYFPEWLPKGEEYAPNAKRAIMDGHWADVILELYPEGHATVELSSLTLADGMFFVSPGVFKEVKIEKEEISPFIAELKTKKGYDMISPDLVKLIRNKIIEYLEDQKED